MKTLIIALVTLIAGGIAGYYIAVQKCGSLEFLDKDAKEAFKKKIIEEYQDKLLAERVTIDPPLEMKPIDPNEAKKLINAYLSQNNQNTDSLQQIRTKDALLRGFFIRKEAIKAMVDELGGFEKDFAGISLYMAKHPQHLSDKSNTFTIVVASAKFIPEAQRIKPYIKYTNGQTWEYVDPCPTNCGTGDGDIPIGLVPAKK